MSATAPPTSTPTTQRRPTASRYMVRTTETLSMIMASTRAAPARRRPTCRRGGTRSAGAVSGAASATPSSSTEGTAEEHQHHGQLAQRVAALAPADGRLGQQVPAEDDGAEDDGLARDRHGGVGAAVRRVVAADHEHVDVLEHRHHRERHRGHDQVEHDRAPHRPLAARARGRGAPPPPSSPASSRRRRPAARPGPHRGPAGVGRGRDLADEDADRGARRARSRPAPGRGRRRRARPSPPGGWPPAAGRPGAPAGGRGRARAGRRRRPR